MKKLVGLALAGLIGVYFLGCVVKIEKFGDAPEENTPKIAIGSILVNPQNYLDQDVVVEGIMSGECSAGNCWIVKDNAGSTIYVDMHGGGLAHIPSKVGRKIIVKGTVFQTESTPSETKILGKGVIIK